MSPRVVIAMGSNLGDRLENLQGGLDALFDTPGLTFVAVSPVFETVPVGGPAQPAYLNAVLIAETALPARAVLDRCHSVEAAFGRTRTQVWGPRTLDLDLIIYGDEVSDDPELTLPHPRAHERAFVLAPWHAADPQARTPGPGTAWRTCWPRPAWTGSPGWITPCCTLPHDGLHMKPTKIRTLALAALVCAMLAWLLLRLVYASLPPLPWTGVPALLLLALAEAVSGRNVRARLRGGGGTQIPPIAVARMAALAKASSLAAAVLGGLAAGFLVYVLGSLDKPAFRTDAVDRRGNARLRHGPDGGGAVPGTGLPRPHPQRRGRRHRRAAAL